jgi:hypothetical protein
VSDKSTWHRVSFYEHRTHIIPTQLLRPYLASITDPRHGAVITRGPEPIREWCLDFGGMILRDSPLERVELRGMTFTIPSHHVEVAIHVLRKRPPDRELTRHHYGFVHWHFAVLLLPAQRHSLLAQLVALEPHAHERATAHHAAIERVVATGKVAAPAPAPEIGAGVN